MLPIVPGLPPQGAAGPPPTPFFLQMAGGAGYVLQTDGASKITI